MLISMIGAALVAANDRTRASSSVRKSRVAAVGPIDAAIATYRFGLQSGKANDNNGWSISGTDLGDILGSTGVQIIPNSQAGPYARVDERGADAVPSAARFTVALDNQSNPNQRSYWQIYRIRTAASGTDLRVWFRAWIGARALSTAPINTSNSRSVVASFRPGRFSDYQLVTNGPIRFDGDSSINGPVHSNGFLDGITVPPNDPDRNPATDPLGNPDGDPNTDDDQRRIWAAPGATVNCANPDDISTGSGIVALDCMNPKTKAASGKFVPFQGLEKSARAIQTACSSPSPTVYCFAHNASTPNPLPVSIASNGDVRINGGSATRYRAYLFQVPIRLTGTTAISTRTTIVAYNLTGSGAVPTIRLNSSIGSTGSGRLGVFAQGDILVDPRAVCPMTVHGVFMSQKGSLTIGRELMTPLIPIAVQQNPNNFSCNRSFTLNGSFAGASAPQLSWAWPTPPVKIGYASRIYSWDKTLRDPAPPYTPETGTWESLTWKDADVSCMEPDVTDPDCL